MNLLPFSLSALRRYWPVLVAGALVLAIIVQTFRLQATEGALSAEKAGRALDRKEYQRAQMEATAKAYAAKIKTEKAYEAEREKADLAAADLGKQYRAIVLRYADAQRAGSGTNLPQPTESTASSNGPGGPAVLPQGAILIPQDDALVCADNTARLEAVREWALGL